MSKTAFDVPVESGTTRKVTVPAINGGFGWTKVSVTFASAGVQVVRAIVGPNERPVDGLAPQPPETGVEFSGRGYVDLVDGDQWILIELGSSPAGTLDLTVEASDAA